MTSILFINIIRYLILSFSLIGLGFHFAQCALLREYQHRVNKELAFFFIIVIKNSTQFYNRLQYQVGLVLDIGRYVLVLISLG